MARQKDTGVERRKYLRLSTIFPVLYQIVGQKDKKPLAEISQAFTGDVGKGGMCLEVTNLKSELAKKLETQEAKLSLMIEVPFSTKSISAFGKVVWSQKIKESYPTKHLFGIEYETISEGDRKSIIRYARALIWRPRLIAVGFTLLVISIAITSHKMFQEQYARESAQRKIYELRREKRNLEGHLNKLSDAKEGIEEQLGKLQNERLSLERKMSELSQVDVSKEQLQELEARLEKSQETISSLQGELWEVSKEKDRLAGDVMKLKGQIPFQAVSVVLAGGRTLEGILLDETAGSLKIKLTTGTVTLDRSDVAKIKSLAKTDALRVEREIEKAELERKKDKKEKKEVMREEAVVGEEEVKRKKIITDEQNIYIDGKPFFIKGIAYNINYPGYPEGIVGFEEIPFEIFEKDFAMMKEAGINTIRSYEPLPDKLLNLAQKYELFVIETVVYPTGYTDYTHAGELITLKETAIRNVLRHKDRPCILMWSIWNDAPFEWGLQTNVVKGYGKRIVNDFLKEIYDVVKEVDPHHPVTAANILKVEGYDVGFDFLDVIGVNAYLGGHGNAWMGQEIVNKDIEELLKISSETKKPIFVAETGFSTFITKDTQDNALKVQLEALDTKTAGVIIFAWTDEWWKAGDPKVQDKHVEEHWGILTAERKKKPGFDIVKEYFNKTPSYLKK